MPVTVDRIIRSKRRTIALIVESDGAITVRAPLRMTETTIQEFVAGHAHWVEKKQAERRAVVPAQPMEVMVSMRFSNARIQTRCA